MHTYVHIIFDYFILQMNDQDLFDTLVCKLREFRSCLHNHLRSFLLWCPDMVLHSANQFVSDTAI